MFQNNSTISNSEVAKLAVVVIGAGVIGMTTAYQLLKNGHTDVTIISKDPPLQTNSDVAAALWRPYDANPQELSTQWSKESYTEFFTIYYDYLKEQAGGNKKEILDPGIQFVTAVEYFGPQGTPKPEWMRCADQLLQEKIQQLTNDQKSALPHSVAYKAATQLLDELNKQKQQLIEALAEAKKHAPASRPEVYASVVPIIDATLYRKWLLHQYQKISGKEIMIETISSLEVNSDNFQNLAKKYNVIINCAGEQARNLASDAQTKPIRGLVVVTELPVTLNYCIGVEPNPDLDQGKINIRYAIIRPRSNTCVMGGTYEELSDSVSSNEEQKQKDKQEILGSLLPLLPGIKNIEELSIVKIAEGFRCGRAEMYYEVKIVKTPDNNAVILGGALGHGGGGYSVSHGVAKHLVAQCKDLACQVTPPKNSYSYSI